LRIGVFGGTFDPPHVGHLLAAVDAYEALSLDKLIFVPAAAQPLKSTVPASASPRDRLEMMRCVVGDDPRFEVSSVEIERGGLSYTVDTLEALSLERPGATFFLILGMDALRTFARWKSPDRIRELATLAVLSREETGRGTELVIMKDVVRIGLRRLDVSSSEIRQRVRDGKPIRGFVTESVESYIATADLYRSEPGRMIEGPAKIEG
jgi:nicotinate-nucleotide adenylyltransferase